MRCRRQLRVVAVASVSAALVALTTAGTASATGGGTDCTMPALMLEVVTAERALDNDLTSLRAAKMPTSAERKKWMDGGSLLAAAYRKLGDAVVGLVPKFDSASKGLGAFARLKGQALKDKGRYTTLYVNTIREGTPGKTKDPRNTLESTSLAKKVTTSAKRQDALIPQVRAELPGCGL